jgi:hypothetical protein
VNDVLDTLNVAVQDSGIAVHTEMLEGMPPVFADRDMLGRIVGNLVSNAIKFSPPHSTVTIRSERSSVSMARVSVIDSGSGISPEDLRRIFHRFEQGSNHAQHGVGLGLAIVRELVKLQGGRVTVESVPGKGSRFHFTLPLFLPTAIVRRHMSALGRSGGMPASAWVLTLQNPTKYDAVHRLITATVRARDLVLPGDSRNSILLVTQARHPERLLAQLQRQTATYGNTVLTVKRLDETQPANWLSILANGAAMPEGTNPSAQMAG